MAIIFYYATETYILPFQETNPFLNALYLAGCKVNLLYALQKSADCQIDSLPPPILQCLGPETIALFSFG